MRDGDEWVVAVVVDETVAVAEEIVAVVDEIVVVDSKD